MKRRCIRYTSTWHRIQRELGICKRLLVHSGKHMNWSHMKPLQSCAKGIRHKRMLEDQAEIAAHPARFGRDITGAQLALTAGYALNVFNLQLHQKLEIHYLKHKVGQLQNANATLTEELGAVQEQNADLQIAVAELDNQLHQLILNDGINQ